MKYLPSVLLCTLGLLACQPSLKTEKVVVNTQTTTVDQRIVLEHEILVKGQALVVGGIDAGTLRTQSALTFTLNRHSNAAINFLKPDNTFAESHLKGVPYISQWEIEDSDGQLLTDTAYKGGKNPKKDGVDFVIPNGFASTLPEGQYLVKLQFYRGTVMKKNQVGETIQRSFKVKRGFNLVDLEKVQLQAKARQEGSGPSQSLTTSLSYDGMRLKAVLRATSLAPVGKKVTFYDFAINQTKSYTLLFPTVGAVADGNHSLTNWVTAGQGSFTTAQNGSGQLKPGWGTFLMHDERTGISVKLVVEIYPS